MTSKEKAQWLVMQTRVSFLEAQLKECESRRQFEGAAYRAKLAEGKPPREANPQLAEIKRLAAQGIRATLRGGVITILEHSA